MENVRQSREKIIIEPAISPIRQVQFIQAILILVGVILGNSVSQWFYMLDIFVGLELLVASLLGESLPEKLFAKFSWNKPFTKNQSSNFEKKL